MINVVGNVDAILHHKNPQVHSIPPETRVFDAIQLMAEKNVGALPVVAEGKLVGMVSERDYTRKVAIKGKSSKETAVREIMNSPVISVGLQHSVEECLRIMTGSRIRHLPVLDGDKLVGIVSIGDLVNWIINAQSATIDQLQSYITGSYPS